MSRRESIMNKQIIKILKLIPQVLKDSESIRGLFIQNLQRAK